MLWTIIKFLEFKPHMKAWNKLSLIIVAGLLGFTACGPRKTAVSTGTENQALTITVGAAVENIDPHVVTGVPEHHVITALFEGLVNEDPKDLHPVPGVAESWAISDDGITYTFLLRDDAKWSHGRQVTAQDFVESFKRILTASLGSKYSYMMFPMKNAEEYLNGQITDWSEVGCKAIDDLTLEITLKESTPYFLSLLNHYTWFPVPIDIIQKYGELYEPGNEWTLPGNFQGNGAFVLKEWVQNNKMVLAKSESYWDRETTKLNTITFKPLVKDTVAEAAFRTGQLHNVYSLPQDQIALYKRDFPDLLHINPHLAVYFYRFNTTKKPLDDSRVRRALALAINRKSLIDNVAKGEQMPAFSMVPPDTAGYTSKNGFEENIEEARKLLAEAGYPNGEGFPEIELLYNTNEGHRNIAEAIQQMWTESLNVNIKLSNQEWKVYLDSQRNLDYDISRAGWTGDYPDPNTFLDMWTSWSEQNQTGWNNKKFDDLIKSAAGEQDSAKRFEFFQNAEAVLLEEMPIIPIYYYTRVYALRPEVKNWNPNILDHHPWKHIYLSNE